MNRVAINPAAKAAIEANSGNPKVLKPFLDHEGKEIRGLWELSLTDKEMTKLDGMRRRGETYAEAIIREAKQ